MSKRVLQGLFYFLLYVTHLGMVSVIGLIQASIGGYAGLGGTVESLS